MTANRSLQQTQEVRLSSRGGFEEDLFQLRPNRVWRQTIPIGDLVGSVAIRQLNRDPHLRGRNVLAFLVSCAVVILTHVLSLAVSIESTYANANGAWSQQHYSAFERQLWISTEFFWRLVGMFAIVFACWWIAQSSRKPAK